VSIGELCPDIDNLDGAIHEGTSTQSYQVNSPPGPSSGRSNRGMNEGVVHATRRASLDDAPGPSSTSPRGYGRGSVRNKVARILSDAPRAILLRTQRLFIDRQYSPSTGMDRSEWEIILEELTCMGYIVKQEHVNETDN
jgi:hypothetical protein